MKIYFDENFSPRLVAGFRELQNGRPSEGIEVCSVVEAFGRGAPDEEWIPAIASRHGVFVTQDLNIHRTRAQRALCGRSKVGVIFFRPPKGGWSYWQIVEAVFKHWPAMKEAALNRPKPFAVMIEQKARKWCDC